MRGRERKREGKKARVRGARERMWGDRVWKKHDRRCGVDLHFAACHQQ